MPQTKHFRSTVSLADHLAKESGLPSEVLVLPKGKWNTLPYGVMEVSEASIDQMIANFETGVRKDVPIDVDHDGKKAAGWVKKLIKTDEGMAASIEWTPYGSELLKNKEYKLFSPEWSFEYLDPLTSAAHGATFIAGTLTNRPLFKQLPNLVANDQSSLTKDSEIVLVLAGEQTMNLSDLLKKAIVDLTAEEKAFIVEHQAELTDEQKVTLKEVLPAPADATAEKEDDATSEDKTEDAADDAAADAEDSTDTEADKTDASTDDAAGAADAATDTEVKPEVEVKAGAEKTVTITASELARFKALESQAAVTAAESHIAKFVANDKGGHILPKSKKEWAAFYLTCSEAQKTALTALLGSLPVHKIAGQIADTESNPLSASETIGKMVNDRLAKEPEGSKKDYGVILKEVLKENPALAESYNSGL